METTSYKDSIIESSRSLKLGGIKGCLDILLSDAVNEKWSYDRFLSEALAKECKHREELKIKGLIKKANFNPMKYLEDLDRTELPKDMAILAPASPIVPSVLA